ncbi:hypothetical protein ZHAS_00000048 [Anopheles sinensis]|uniref:Uncharacterized protein n=1 Tax=Anopheles sinensis TaxID=74873 RepID=A0A084V9T6_ANOSI|nr:hypothetical protein ZHAS_00000048 [Anopheles sinensis]
MEITATVRRAVKLSSAGSQRSVVPVQPIPYGFHSRLLEARTYTSEAGARIKHAIELQSSGNQGQSRLPDSMRAKRAALRKSEISYNRNYRVAGRRCFFRPPLSRAPDENKRMVEIGEKRSLFASRGENHGSLRVRNQFGSSAWSGFFSPTGWVQREGGEGEYKSQSVKTAGQEVTHYVTARFGGLFSPAPHPTHIPTPGEG